MNKSSEGKGIKRIGDYLYDNKPKENLIVKKMKSPDKKKTKELEWEKEFENQFGIDNELAKEIKSFISSLLDKQRTELLEEILEENFCDLDGTYDYDGIAQSVIDLHKKL